MRISKALAAVIALLACFGASAAALNFALEPYGSKSEVVWQGYAQQEDIDTVFIGTSESTRGFVPSVIDEKLGANSYNLSSPDQTLEESLAGIQTAYNDHQIKRVVLGLQFTALQRSEVPNLGSAYLRQRNKVAGPQEAASTGAWLVAEKDAATATGSINLLLPFTSNHVVLSSYAVKKNVAMKLDGTSLEQAEVTNEPGWIDLGQGAGGYDLLINYDSNDAALFGVTEKIEELSIEQKRVDTLNDICRYCSERNIELVVVGPPIPVFNIMGYGDVYYSNQAVVKDVLASNGVAYHDFNYAKPELFSNDPNYFMDNTHLSVTGGRAFSASIASFIQKLDSGEDVDSLFYTQEEYLGTLDYISAVVVSKASVTAEGIQVTAQACCGPDVTPEYQFSVKTPEDEDFRVVSEYSTRDSRTIDPGAHGTCTVRVSVRELGSNVAYDHYNDWTLFY